MCLEAPQSAYTDACNSRPRVREAPDDPPHAARTARAQHLANRRVLDAVARLDADGLTRVLGGSYPSVQATLTHTLWAEWLWLERWQGRSPMELFTPEEFPSASEFRSRWSPVQGAQEAFLAALAPDDLQRVLHYTNRNGEVSPGQVTNMLRLLGAQPATTDFLEFLGRKGNGRVSVKITRRSNRG